MPRLPCVLNACLDVAVCRNADVEEQISHLRAQLLRSEQDNELMRIKLEQETAEREKAQKQVRNAWLYLTLFRGLCVRLLLPTFPTLRPA